MRLCRSCATIYLPARGGGIRRLAVPVWVAVAAIVGVPTASAIAIMLALGTGPAWLRGGSPLARQNAVLRATMIGMDQQVEELANEVAALAAERERLADVLQGSALGVADLTPFVTGPGADPRQVGARARDARRQYSALVDSVVSREAARARIPSCVPCTGGWTSSLYGPRLDPFTGRRAFHRGVDFSLPSGSPVVATGSGRVASVERQTGLGLVIKIDHGSGLQTVYAHLQRALVKAGQEVARGEVIARSGSSGRSSAPHLHYEVRRDGRSVNPRPYLQEFPVASR